MLRRCWARTVLLALPVTLGAAAPADAVHFRQYHGVSPQGEVIYITAGAEAGRFASVSLRFHIRCRRHNFRWTYGLVDAPYELTRTRHRFRLRYEEILREVREGGPRVVVKMSGRRVTPGGRPAREYWRGRLTLRAEFLDPRDGTVSDRCGSGPMRWRARREGVGTGRWTMTSDPGEELGRGRSHALRDVSAIGGSRGIEAHAPAARSDIEAEGREWTAIFVAPRGSRLVRGTTFTDLDDDSLDDGELIVSAPDLSCEPTLGEVRVERARYDRRDRLRAIRISFTQRCGDAAYPGAVVPALHGTVVFRRRR